MNDTLLSTKHLGVVCAVSGAGIVDSEDYGAWLTLLEQSEGEEVRVLFRTKGATPDARQRRALFEVTRDRYFRVAVLTDSQEALSNMTEFEWLGHIEIRGFSYCDFDTAFDYLNVSDAFYPGLERKVLSLTRQLLARSSDRATSGVDTYAESSRSNIKTHRSHDPADDEVG